MSTTVEQIVVALVVLAAVAYLGRRLWRKLRRNDGSCCGTTKKTTLTIGGSPVKKR